MVLTRTLKELWLFGDLETIPQGDEKDVESKQQMEMDEKLVVQAFLGLMAKTDGNNRLTSNGAPTQSGTDS